MPLKAFFAVLNAPVKFVSKTSEKSALLVLAAKESRVMPAFAIRISTVPSVSSTSLNVLSMCSSSVTSHEYEWIPKSSIPSGGVSRYVIATLFPFAAKTFAVARPIPLFPPVIRTTRSICSLLFFLENTI